MMDTPQLQKGPKYSTCYSVADPPRHCSRCKELDPKGYRLCDSIFMMSWKRQHSRNGEKISGVQGLEVGEEVTTGGLTEHFWVYQAGDEAHKT